MCPGDKPQHGPARQGDCYWSTPARSKTASTPLPKSPNAVSTKTGFAQYPTDVARAGAAAFNLTDVFARARADEVIADGETTEEISPSTAGCLKTSLQTANVQSTPCGSHFLMIRPSLIRTRSRCETKYFIRSLIFRCTLNVQSLTCCAETDAIFHACSKKNIPDWR